MPTTPSKKSAVKGGSLEVVDGKNIHIPLYDAGGGKVLLAYYAEDGENSSNAGIKRVLAKKLAKWKEIMPSNPLPKQPD